MLQWLTFLAVFKQHDLRSLRKVSLPPALPPYAFQIPSQARVSRSIQMESPGGTDKLSTGAVPAQTGAVAEPPEVYLKLLYIT